MLGASLPPVALWPNSAMAPRAPPRDPRRDREPAAVRSARHLLDLAA